MTDQAQFARPQQHEGKSLPSDWTKSVRTGTFGVSAVGYLIIALFVGGFGTWAATAPLSGAVIVPGFVAAAAQNQVIQHLEGGILRRILVREGDQVTAGQPLFELDKTRAETTLNALNKQLISMKARQARLRARMADKQDLVFPEDLVADAAAAGLEDILDEQRDEFRARLFRHNSERLILAERVKAAREAISGLESQRASLEEQLEVVRAETQRKKKLLDDGLTNRSEYTLLLRSQADLVGQVGSISSQIEQTRSRVIEAQEELVRQQSSRIEDAIGEINDVSVRIGDAEEKLYAARDVLDRAIVRSPSDGLVIRITKTSQGSVVQPGEDLAYMLPTASELILEAKLNPADIDRVRIGQSARLRFSALNARTTPEVPGEVIFVSPDRLVDKEGNPFYAARIEISDDLPEEIDRGQIYPGMPVEAMISTGERTFFEYLLQPLMDSFARAFRES